MGDIFGVVENLQVQVEVQVVIDVEKVVVEVEVCVQVEVQVGLFVDFEVVVEELMVFKYVLGDIKEMIGNVILEVCQVKVNEIMIELQMWIDNDIKDGKFMGLVKFNLFQKVQKDFVKFGVVGFFCVVDVDLSFINWLIVGDGCFNVYVLDKICDMIMGIDGGFLKNLINCVVLLLFFNFWDVGVFFIMSVMQVVIFLLVCVEMKGIFKYLVWYMVVVLIVFIQFLQMSYVFQVMGIVIVQIIGWQMIFMLIDIFQVCCLEEVLWVVV